MVFLDHDSFTNLGGGTMKTLLALLLGLGCMGHQAAAQDVQRLDVVPYGKLIPIPVFDNWTWTGVNVSAGDTVVIIMSGIAATEWLPERLYNWVGPEGAGREENGLPVHGVIGKIGSSGTPFAVGRGTHFRALTSGVLYLGYNDDIFGDNYGYYLAYILSPSTGVNPVTSVVGNGEEVPREFGLEQNYPNPFNPKTRIDFQLPSSGQVKLLIYDSLGRLVRVLVDDHLIAGSHAAEWDGRDERGIQMASGTYFYQILVDEEILTKKMIVLK